MNCARCNKRLSRKTARLIDGVILCSPCMFGQAPRDSRPLPERDETRSGSVAEGHRAAVPKAIAQPFQPHPKDSSPCP